MFDELFGPQGSPRSNAPPPTVTSVTHDRRNQLTSPSKAGSAPPAAHTLDVMSEQIAKKIDERLEYLEQQKQEMNKILQYDHS